MTLDFKFSDGLYFAHDASGMFTIEQHRRTFLVTFQPKGASMPEIALGDEPTKAKAIALAKGYARDFRNMSRA